MVSVVLPFYCLYGYMFASLCGFLLWLVIIQRCYFRALLILLICHVSYFVFILVCNIAALYSPLFLDLYTLLLLRPNAIRASLTRTWCLLKWVYYSYTYFSLYLLDIYLDLFIGSGTDFGVLSCLYESSF